MTHVRLATPDTVRQGGVYKYVRMVDDTVRFVEVSFYTPDHIQMIDEGEVAKSAGSIVVRPQLSADRVRTCFHGSQTLRLPSLEDDEAVIASLLFPEST